MDWRLIETAAAPGAVNMAVDQLLFDQVKAGGPPSLRFYHWSPPCLSLGRNQPARGRVREARAAALGVDIVRRPTGGMAVLHDNELTYSVAVPVGRLGSPRQTYRAINRGLVAGLRRLGVPAEVAGEEAPGGRRLDGPCFQAAAPGEVVVEGRKLVGSAMRCEGRTLLQHGSLLLGGAQERVAELLAGEHEPGAPAATLHSVLGRPPELPALVAALRAGFEEVLGIRFARTALADEEDGRLRALEEHFRSAAWTWRR